MHSQSAFSESNGGGSLDLGEHTSDSEGCAHGTCVQCL